MSTVTEKRQVEQIWKTVDARTLVNIAKSKKLKAKAQDMLRSRQELAEVLDECWWARHTREVNIHEWLSYAEEIQSNYNRLITNARMLGIEI